MNRRPAIKTAARSSIALAMLPKFGAHTFVAGLLVFWRSSCLEPSRSVMFSGDVYAGDL